MRLLRSVLLLVSAGSLAFGCSSSTPTPDADSGFADLGVTDVGSMADRGTITDRGAPDTGSGSTCGGTLGACNVVTNANCAPGEGCYAGRSADGGVGATCAPAGSRGWGEACTTANGCREGFACLGTQAPA